LGKARDTRVLRDASLLQPRFNNLKNVSKLNCVDCLLGWKGEQSQVECLVNLDNQKVDSIQVNYVISCQTMMVINNK